jgi:broad specificity phosphatase PhoE
MNGLDSNYVGNITLAKGLRPFIVVRHGVTDLNIVIEGGGAEPLFYAQGSGTDVELNDKGVAQALKLKPIFASMQHQLVVSFALIRARQTATHAGLFFIVDTGLNERNFGSFEGTLQPSSFFGGTIKNAESSEHFTSRIATTLERYASNEDCVLVTHGGVLRIIATLLNVELLPEQLRNAHVVRFSPSASGWTATSVCSPAILITDLHTSFGYVIVRGLIDCRY